MSSSNSSHISLSTSSSLLGSSPTTTASSSRVQTFKAQSYQQLLHKTRLKLKDSNVRRPRRNTHPSQSPVVTSSKAPSFSTMDPYNPQYQGSNSSGQSSSSSKGKSNDPGVLDGLLPRIETRGQSRGGSSKSGGQKDKGSNSYWYE